jgi:hypothetical protein
MSYRSFRPWIIRCAAFTVTLAASVLVMPVAAHADDPWRAAVSGYTADRVKAVAAHCPDGQHVAGGGAQIIGNDGDVALAALVPDPVSNTMTATAVARADRTAPWAVGVVAVCESRGWDAPVRVRSTEVNVLDGTVTAYASCANGFVLTGVGFDATNTTGTALLAGVVPSPDDTSVAVRLSVGPATATVPVAYGLCVPDENYYNPDDLNGYHEELNVLPPGSNPVGSGSPKTATATFWPGMNGTVTGVGGAVTGGATDVFIDAMMPNPALTSTSVRATRVRAGTVPAAVRAADDPAGGDDDFGVAATGTAAVVYY